MSDKSMAMIMVTAIAAPVMIICCGGGAAFLVSALAGTLGFLSGSGALTSALIAMFVGVFVLAMRSWHWARQKPVRRVAGQG